MNKRDAVALIVTILIATLGISQVSDEPSCQGVDQSLESNRRTALEQVYLQRSKNAAGPPVEQVDVLYSMRYRGWEILHIENYVADDGWDFYHGDPLTTRPVTAWGGWNGWNEGPELKAWVVQYVPGIPPKLAACFVSLVTPSRPSEDEIRNLPKS